jgi:hypothetical protein
MSGASKKLIIDPAVYRIFRPRLRYNDHFRKGAGAIDRRSPAAARWRHIFSTMVAPGRCPTASTMTRPGSPRAWTSRATRVRGDASNLSSGWPRLTALGRPRSVCRTRTFPAGARPMADAVHVSLDEARHPLALEDPTRGHPAVNSRIIRADHEQSSARDLRHL